METKHTDQTSRPRKIRLPGFIPDEEVGLGDVIKRATSTLGIKPCGPCNERAARLNQRVVFAPWQRR
jgi:hypothetical protein